MTSGKKKPCVIITGAAGKIGQALTAALRRRYRVVGLDIRKAENCDAAYEFDLTNLDSVRLAVGKIADEQGGGVAAAVHLAAYFDFSGEESPLYDAVNVKGTENLLEALKELDVGRFIYSSTMLVHKPAVPGAKISEDSPLDPKWAYPKSKHDTEQVIAEKHGDMPYTILRLAGLYDEKSAVPTLTHQIARIYENNLKSHLYAGDQGAGQAFIHRDDLVDLFCRAVDRRKDLPKENVILAGEDVSASYEALQNRIGELVHGKERWKTLNVPAAAARAAAWAEEKSEPVVPDDIDRGEKPFIRPFMIDRASDHYELDISRAEKQLGWVPRHRILDELPALVDSLQADPVGWYKGNGITPPDWLDAIAEKETDANRIRERYRERYLVEHGRARWAYFMTAGLGGWLLVAPFALGYQDVMPIASDMVAGAVILLFGLASVSVRLAAARWVCAAAGLWLMAAPLIFWASDSGAYFNGTLVGALVFGFSFLTRPSPGISPAAALTGPITPPGWTMNPSGWPQRFPIILLALVGFCISAYLTGYQLGYVDRVWDPFFTGGNGPKNGTEEIITSFVSHAWPVPDAGLGAMTYMLEILTGLLGSTRRWRTMPWVVVLFGFLIVPLGGISIFFIIIQPIWIGTWCTLCLVAAAAMLVQIPYSLDELVATGQFLRRRVRKGRPFLRVFFTGDTDDEEDAADREPDAFARPALQVICDMLGGGVGLSWNMGVAIAVGVWLMLAPLTLGTTGGAADASHLIGALAITVAVIAFAEIGRLARFFLIPLGLAQIVVPFAYAVSTAELVSALVSGGLLVAMAMRRGPVRCRFGAWDRFVK